MGGHDYYRDDQATLLLGDALDVLPTLADASVDAVVCDPPYELGFMGKVWDASGIAYNVDVWRHCWRVLKPGGHLVAFGGTRTYHRLAVAIEDAGFEIRDSLHWIYGSGFPKSLDVSKAIDKRAEENSETKRRIAAVAQVIRSHREAAGLTRQEVSQAVVGTRTGACWNWEHHQLPSAELWPAIKATLNIADRYDGLIDGNRSQFIAAEREVIGKRSTGLGTGRGAVAIIGDSENRDLTAPATESAARWSGFGTALKPAHEPIVLARKPLAGTVAANVLTHGTGAINVNGCRVAPTGESRERVGEASGAQRYTEQGGTNFAALPSIFRGGDPAGRWPTNILFGHDCAETCVPGCPVGELGDQARFFPVFRYQAKAPSKERPKVNGVAHPTVKPIALMRWLVRLVTPPGGTVLDWCTGTGTTLEAAILEGFQAIGIERETDYIPLCLSRLARAASPVGGEA